MPRPGRRPTDFSYVCGILLEGATPGTHQADQPMCNLWRHHNPLSGDHSNRLRLPAAVAAILPPAAAAAVILPPAAVVAAILPPAAAAVAAVILPPAAVVAAILPPAAAAVAAVI